VVAGSLPGDAVARARAAARAATAAAAGAARSLQFAPADPILEWYDLTAAAVAATGPVPAETSRAWAIAWHAADRAVHDLRGTRAATAALVTALHDVVVNLVPPAAEVLDEPRERALARLRGRRAIARGRAAGALAAADALSDRADDGSNPAAWRPYLIDSVSDAGPPPPPGPDQPGYARDLAETRQLGAADSTAREPRQTDVARFWTQPPLAVFTPALRAALVGLKAPFADRVELVALVHAITLDAQICGYAARENHPRRRPAHLLSRAGRAWTPLIATGAGELEYPCLRATYAGAAEIALTALAGHPPVPITLTSETAPGVTLRYRDWRQLTADCVDAGVWSGAHLRSAGEAGAALGRRVAFRALNRASRRGHRVA